MMHSKRLYIRLSSLGDLILATSVLDVEKRDPAREDHWLTLSEYASLINTHPRLKQVISFQKREGLKAWISLSRRIWESGYSEIYDLHRTLRTRLMKVLFLYWSRVESKKMPLWKTISKQRFKLWGYFLFKKGWPQSWRPEAWVVRYTRFVGGTGKERPNLTHLFEGHHFVLPKELQGVQYLCVMPSSKWLGKVWPVEFFFSLLQTQFSSAIPVVLGTSTDSQSLRLVEMLKMHKMSHYSGIGIWSFQELAHVLKNSIGILGVDTGLPHFAESLGVPTITLFGPTQPDMGFGPWHPKSRALGMDLSCRPCSKDGRMCYRFFQPYYCLKGYTPESAMKDLKRR